MHGTIDVRSIRHFHLFCGLGGGAAGFNRGSARVGNMIARFECIGGIDVDRAGIADFERLTGTAGTVLDLFDREQFLAFHGMEPPPGWREATPADIHAAAGHRGPHIVFLSAPCKGFSGLLAEKQSRTAKYQALNGLTVRGMWLTLEAWSDDPPELVIFENVPRIGTRGRPLIDRIIRMLEAYGYAVAETVHDCGELGGLAQSRKRFLLVARHRAKVPPFLYEPPKLPLRGVGEILDKLPLPGDIEAAGPMHRVPSLQWQTWVRLAFIEAGKDWRSLNRLRVEDGYLADYAIAAERNHGFLGVNRWDEAAGTVAGRSGPHNGNFSVADPRFGEGMQEYGQLGVGPWAEPASTIINVKSPGQGRYAVADPRHSGPAKHNNQFRIVRWERPAGSVTSAHGSGAALADPRPTYEGDYKQNKYKVTRIDDAAGAVIAASTTGNGAFAVADPRWHGATDAATGYQTQGHYGVCDWSEPTGAIPAFTKHDRGRWSVADPRELPAPADRMVCRIIAEDGTWHRPFTTLELAALQSLFDPEEMFSLEGQSDSAWRERIGNAVPRDSAAAIASTMGRTLLLAWSGETFMLSADPIWVRPLTMALAVQAPELPA